MAPLTATKLSEAGSRGSGAAAASVLAAKLSLRLRSQLLSRLINALADCPHADAAPLAR
jgi:hypothetical protein